MSELHAIESFSVPAQVTGAATIVVLGGLSDLASTHEVQAAYDAYANVEDNFLNMVFIPDANPAKAALVFPPPPPAFASHWAAWTLWRWLGTHVPDGVIIVGNDDYGLGAALNQDLMGLGRVPPYNFANSVELINAIRGHKIIPLTTADEALVARKKRPPRAIAEGLARVYGQELKALTYIPAMALIGRLRLGQQAEVENIVAPYLATADTLEIKSSLQIAGHLLFAELAQRTNNTSTPHYLQLARRAADLGFDSKGNMLEAMPFNGDYSDAFFMETPLLAKVGKLTGETRYFDMALRHVDFLQAKLLRADGLYNHWPRTEAAWGRGNAFVALGLALALTDIPPQHPAHQRLLEIFQPLMQTLLNYMDADGMWHNIINMPASWAELSATAMIATAMQRGVDQDWLDSYYENAVNNAWESVLARTDADYGFIDVCESTAGQASLDAYLNRKALSGRDDRAGGMMLMFATERLQSH